MNVYCTYTTRMVSPKKKIPVSLFQREKRRVSTDSKEINRTVHYCSTQVISTLGLSTLGFIPPFTIQLGNKRIAIM